MITFVICISALIASSCHLGGLLIALTSICCVMFTANDSEVVDCGHEFTVLLFSFRSTCMSL